MAQFTEVFAALVESLRVQAETEYQSGVRAANIVIENRADDSRLDELIGLWDRIVSDLEAKGEHMKALAMRGFRDTLVEYRDSVGDV